MHGLQSANLGADYTSDDLEFLLAMRRFMFVHNRKFPTFSEVLAVAKSIGYKRQPADRCQNCSCRNCKPAKVGAMRKAERIVNPEYT